MQFLKWLLVMSVVLLTVAVTVFLSIGFFLSPQDEPRKADAIVAISGGETDTRTTEAIKLYQQGLAPKLVFSGAAEDTSGPSNAAAMRAIAVERGVAAKDIIIEEVSKTTAENAAATAPIVRSLKAKTIILVTSPYHQRRASLNFHQELPEVTIINHSSPDHSWRKNAWWSTQYSYDLTLSELQKTFYVLSTKPGAQK